MTWAMVPWALFVLQGAVAWLLVWYYRHKALDLQALAASEGAMSAVRARRIAALEAALDVRDKIARAKDVKDAAQAASAGVSGAVGFVRNSFGAGDPGAVPPAPVAGPAKPGPR